MKRKKSLIPKHLLDVLINITNNEGDDIFFVLGYLNNSTSQSYVSKLKKRGLAYTYVSNGTIEVWATKTGRELVEKIKKENELKDIE